MAVNNITTKVSHWIEQEEKLCELILTPDGNLFVDANFEFCADWFLIFYDGNVCLRPHDSLWCFGSRPDSCTLFPIYVGESTIYANDESDCVLHSDHPVLDCDLTAFAVFRYGDMLGMYTADTTLSRRIHFRAMVSTPANKDYVLEAFFEQLARPKPELAKAAANWFAKFFEEE